jgi:filamentous hemagglutinin family protein
LRGEDASITFVLTFIFDTVRQPAVSGLYDVLALEALKLCNTFVKIIEASDRLYSSSIFLFHLCLLWSNACCSQHYYRGDNLMPSPSWHTALLSTVAVGGVLVGWTNLTAAQRRPIADETLGNERSIVTPQDNIRGVPADRIEGGARRGNNLFHSFREFHVDQGRGVYFNDPGVENILSRVTGGVGSQILGVLGVLGNANLFLINPSGIIFGPNARLDLRGSFAATTADTVQFGEQGFFSASDPTALPLLTVQPSAFLFNQLKPARIINNSTVLAAENPSRSLGFGLQVPAGESLLLLGGNVSMDGGGMVALGGRVEVGGLGEPGTVTLKADGSLGFPTGIGRADVSLTNQSRINVVAGDGGSITMNARELEIVGSFLSAGIGSNSGFVGAEAGDITLNVSNIRARDGAIISNLVGIDSIGSSGDIRITADFLSLTSEARLAAITFGQGNAGNVIIHARDHVVLNNGDIFSSVDSINSDATAVGNGGDIRITTGSLSLINSALLFAATLGQGNAGNVIIAADDRVVFDGVGADGFITSAAASSVEASGIGSGGDINIDTGSLVIRNGAGLTTSTRGQGRAGNIRITADTVSLDGVGKDGGSSGLFTTTFSGAQGRGGSITIDANSIRLRNRAVVNAQTLNRFQGGDATLNADTFEVTGGAQLITTTSGSGRAGAIALDVANRITLSGFDLDYDDRLDQFGRNRVSNRGESSGLFASTTDNSSGRGGIISITTRELDISDRARVVVNSQGSGVAGNIDISAQSVQLNRGRLTSETDARADGGNIRLRDTNLLLLRNGSDISTSAGTAGAGGDGGDIDIDADFVVAAPQENSDIRANAFTGRGGDVRINSQGLFGIAALPQDNVVTSDITASSERGVQGTVEITTLDTDPRRGLTELPATVVDASNQITQTCIGRGAEASKFVVSGRGGLPPSPLDALIGEESLSGWVTLDQAGREESKDGEAGARLALPSQASNSATPIVEAQGWIRGEDGDVKLMAAVPASVAQPAAICP